MEDPNCPKFLEGHVKKLKEAWDDTNEKAQARYLPTQMLYSRNLYFENREDQDMFLDYLNFDVEILQEKWPGGQSQVLGGV